MARGWESKDVASQMESTATAAAKPENRDEPTEARLRDKERKGIELSRTRILNDLQSATNPNHRKSLEAALAHLDKKLSELP
jgi:hypothetical protein